MSFIKAKTSNKRIKELTFVSSFLFVIGIVSPATFAANKHFVGLSVYLTDNHFSEKDNSKTLNTENGQMDGFALSAATELDSNWMITGDVIKQSTNLSYQGFSQNGVAINTQTKYQQQEYAFATRYLHQAFFTSIGLNHNRDKRYIQGIEQISGLNESYQFNFVTLGAGWQKNISENIQLEVAANLGYSVKSSLTVDFLNKYDTSRGDLNKVTRYQLSAQLGYTLTQSQQLLLTVQYQQTNISQSEQFNLTEQGKHKGFFYQPQRQLEQNSLVLSYRFFMR
ncbi:hypothetical protein ACMZOO_08705 [Catenovulum sp. SX2]|uniref:hypothetical protein n=1 Tax=Catenovulum sp. SX2 TaxID=3398614 RepID=UPI003F82AC84